MSEESVLSVGIKDHEEVIFEVALKDEFFSTVIKIINLGSNTFLILFAWQFPTD